MSAADFLVELGTEELPPTALLGLSEAFEAGIVAQLKDANIEFGAVKAFASPRRLAVQISDLALAQPDEAFERKGPAKKAAFDADGNPTKALQGFLRGCGGSVEDLSEMETPKGTWLIYKGVQKGKPTAELLPGFVSESLNKLPIPKRMRSGTSRSEFVRPVKWLVMLLGSNIVEAEVLNLKAGNVTRGHRIHGVGEITLNSPAEYAERLEKEGYVLADFAKRRELIRQGVEKIAGEVKGTAVIDPDLLDEVTALNEWPMPLIGNFGEEFLDVPAEALISSMKEHQKYFHVVDSKGELLPNFITVANIESKDPAQVVSGNEKVIRPRLADAKFFWDTDRKQKLENRFDKLETVTFQKDLGSVADKARRISALASNIAGQIGGDETMVARAAHLAKCDLVTQMVFEFTDLQGLAGRYYAENDGEAAEVASAIEEQYLPKFAGDHLPQTKTGQAIALADRIDTLVGIFGIGQPPSGSKDPFALRRASVGVLRIIQEGSLDLDLRQLLSVAAAQHPALKVEDVVEQVLSYMLDRLSAVYGEQNINPEIFQAVRALGVSKPLDIDRRVKAVAEFAKLDAAAALAAANKRVSNILAKQGITETGSVEEAKFEQDEERTLWTAVQAQQATVAPLIAAGDFQGSLASLADLRAPVDAFFDNVMVMADDEAVRANRLALLGNLRDLFLQTADLAVLG